MPSSKSFADPVLVSFPEVECGLGCFLLMGGECREGYFREERFYRRGG